MRVGIIITSVLQLRKPRHRGKEPCSTWHARKLVEQGSKPRQSVLESVLLVTLPCVLSTAWSWGRKNAILCFHELAYWPGPVYLESTHSTYDHEAPYLILGHVRAESLYNSNIAFYRPWWKVPYDVGPWLCQALGWRTYFMGCHFLLSWWTLADVWPICVLRLHALYVKITRWPATMIHMNVYGYSHGVLECLPSLPPAWVLKVPEYLK